MKSTPLIHKQQTKVENYLAYAYFTAKLFERFLSQTRVFPHKNVGGQKTFVFVAVRVAFYFRSALMSANLSEKLAFFGIQEQIEFGSLTDYVNTIFFSLLFALVSK